MLVRIASPVMARTTLNLDAAILRELKRRARAEGKSIGELVSELLAPALSTTSSRRAARFTWHAAPMGPAKVDLEDKEAVHDDHASTVGTEAQASERVTRETQECRGADHLRTDDE